MGRDSKDRKWRQERRIRERIRNGERLLEPFRHAGDWSDEVWDPEECADELDDEDSAEFEHLWAQSPSREAR